MAGDAAAAQRQTSFQILRSHAPLLDRALWSCASVFAGLLLVSFYHHQVGWVLSAGVTALVLCAAVRPFNALLLLAALGPLAEIMLVLTGANSTGVRLPEALTLAFLTGWAARRAWRPRPLSVSPWLGWAATILIALTFASALVQQAVALAEAGSSASGNLVSPFFSPDYLVSSNPQAVAMLLVEGLVLLLVVADLCAGDGAARERLLRMLVAGAAAAASFNLLRLVTAAARQEHPWATFATYFATVRVNVHHQDLNAAGSYFALMLPIAAALVTRVRTFAVICTLLILAGVWMTGSRTALAAMVLTALMVGIAALRLRGRRKAPVVVALVLVSLAAAALWMWYPQRTYTASAWWSLRTRIDLAKAALQMTAEHPVFGVGVGGFYRLSDQYVPGTLASLRKVGENAHNYYLQIAAELGVSGLLIFVSVLVLAIRQAVRTAAAFPQAWGVLAGLAAFLLTCLAGHPLLVSAVAYPFWIALGLAASPDALVPSMGRRARLAAVALLLAVVAMTPVRVAFATTHADLEHTGIGMSRWQRTPDGVRYRWAGGRSAFFVTASARRISIPLHAGSKTPPAIEVRIFLDEREANRVVLQAGDDWRDVVLLPGRRIEAPFSRIDLQVCLPGTGAVIDVPPTDAAGLLMVGRLRIE